MLTNFNFPYFISIISVVNDFWSFNIRKQFDDITSRVNVYDGKIDKAINYSHAIFDKPKEKIEEDDRFKKLVIAYCPHDFFVQNLKLKPEEKEIFLNFCDVDPQSKILLEHPNALAFMEFLNAKNEEFKKTKIKN